ncbi:general stress protein [Calothrix sp. 336/3]|uniref:general stress protein n=1 Tax=Calothrix sp. 336/3 TaxID=1337936 RepID=UPI0004E36E3A|nr:general stress protein [Calothrix sp. 336/3]AKG21126.1 histidine kinase [Calothrix sp. 336/3]
MVLQNMKRAIGVFPTRSDAEYALTELRDAGFAMNKVSVIAKDDRSVAGLETTQDVDNKADEGAVTGAVTGATLGGLTGLLVGLGTLAIPGVGPILLAGEIATALATTAAGAAIGAAAGSLLGALVGLGIPEERAKIYSDRVSRGEYLVIIEGLTDEINRAEIILRHRGIQEFDIYDAPELQNSNYSTTTDSRYVAGDRRDIGL